MPEKLSKYNKNGDEITRHGFVSNMEAFIQKLLSGKIDSQTNDYLLSHGISSNIALKYLLDKPNKNDPRSAVLSRKESIKTDKETNKDRFHIKYTLNDRQNLERKLRNIYIKLFEYHIVDDNKLLNEEGICDAGEIGYEAPFEADSFKIGKGKKKKDKENERPHDTIVRREYYHIGTNESKHMKRTIIISEEQEQFIKEAMGCETAGAFQYDVPFGAKKGDPTLNHQNMLRDKELSK